jgi:type IV secretion system protein VirB9
MNKNFSYIVVCVCAAMCAVSCASVDVDKTVKTSRSAGKTAASENIIVAVPIETEQREPVVIEKPIYIPWEQSAPASAQGRAAVIQANKEGVAQPREYSNAAMIYDFNSDFVYEVYCQPFRVSDLALQPGERTVETPFISDSERWMLGAGVSQEAGADIQHIYVKPTVNGLSASLIINTNARVYHIILRSYADVHMPMVRWRYHDTAMPNTYLPPPAPASGAPGAEEDAALVDARFLSFKYRIRYGLFKKPSWLPTLVYDDGKKTYITFPETVLQAELPAVYENRADVVNYRVAGNIMIIDKLIRRLTVKLGSYAVTVEKKRGSS